MPRTSIWRCASWPGRTCCSRRHGGSNCRRRAAAGSAISASRCGRHRRCAEIDASVSRTLRCVPSTPSCAPAQRSTKRRGRRSTTRSTTGCSCCCCARPPPRACATRISPRSRRSPRRLAADDISFRAAVARGATLLHRAWGSRQRGAHQTALHVARILPALRRAADAGRGDRRLPAQPQPRPRRAHDRR